ncbi:uncharacterized protein BCR38DRAFT_483108 [Pseudomassariella vexata]|uniref:Uncharacterized protein n=1 Tax=Pseudomassariella vexata TaxID=1141098 RepID=A0A1Y2E7E1_9PEZI|nr:uncharacterized protein BCR38DRAFT_483108 [Pseudomassariella vexata]ORY67493.1 hypothetical protein BCR38DRAFT_483108 [Pseudomassariella vexata]
MAEGNQQLPAGERNMPSRSKVTCLSSEPHEDAINDHLVHFMGCLELCDREDFFKETNSIWEAEIAHQQKLGKSVEEAKSLVDAKRATWFDNCDSEQRRISVLRDLLLKDQEEAHLITDIIQSGKKWRIGDKYTEGIAKVKDWSNSEEKELSTERGCCQRGCS